ncbi:DMT family transporter [Sporolactobacillus pectinivorans]|uniref:DMT family transporter n=1 Tax=Sporolactobacillus pectinivorans TaxID=1591408 RepID=UPI000C26B05F|nr:DMT family transporter [Sporolactobacillus pectinivorans]
MTNEKQRNGIYYILLLLVPLFWGGAFGATKHVITEISPLTAATVRFGLASLILLAITIFSSEWKINFFKKNGIGILLMALTGIFGYNAFFFESMKYTSAINGSLIMATTPVFVTLGAVFFLNESWNRRIGFGLLLSLFGVFLVIVKGSLQTIMALKFNIGDLLLLAALGCWVIHGLIGKIVMKTYPPLLTTTASMLIGSLFLAVGSLFENDWGNITHITVQAWIEIAFMTLCSTVVAFFLWNKGIQKIGASKTSMYMNLVPINATWISLLFYGSSITWQQIMGMVFVIIGVFFATDIRKINSRKTKQRKIVNLN